MARCGSARASSFTQRVRATSDALPGTTELAEESRRKSICCLGLSRSSLPGSYQPVALPCVHPDEGSNSRGLQLGNIRPTERQIEQFCAKFGTSARAVYGNARNPSGYEKHLVKRIGVGPVKALGEPVGAIDVTRYCSNLYLFEVPAPGDRTQCLRIVPSEYLSKLIRDKSLEFQEATPETCRAIPSQTLSSGFVPETPNSSS